LLKKKKRKRRDEDTAEGGCATKETTGRHGKASTQIYAGYTDP
jgi:hypothetical protein